MKPIQTTWAVIIVAALLVIGGTISTALIVAEQHQRLAFEREQVQHARDVANQEAARAKVQAETELKAAQEAEQRRQVRIAALMDALRGDDEKRKADEDFNRKIDSLVSH